MRYWNGPRSELAPRVQAQARALPVYFWTGFCGEENQDQRLVGPNFFMSDMWTEGMLEDEEVDTVVDPACQAGVVASTAGARLNAGNRRRLRCS